MLYVEQKASTYAERDESKQGRWREREKQREEEEENGKRILISYSCVQAFYEDFFDWIFKPTSGKHSLAIEKAQHLPTFHRPDDR